MSGSISIGRDPIRRARDLLVGYLKGSPSVLAAVRTATAPWLRIRPIEARPAWLGRLHEVAVPRLVQPYLAPSPASQANINVIFSQLEQTQSVDGDIAECGVWRGRTLASTALWLQQHSVRKHVFGFDSFSGFPDDAIAVDLEMGGEPYKYKRHGAFADTSLELLIQKLARLGLSEMVTLEAGWFSDSLPRHGNRRFSFVHLDCDVYQSYKECLEFFYPRMSPGGVVLFDEYNDPAWPGCNRAVDEFLSDKPVGLEMIERDNHQKWFFRVHGSS
jgi:Predicted O-methyltransferase